jgi:hypothetical protein
MLSALRFRFNFMLLCSSYVFSSISREREKPLKVGNSDWKEREKANLSGHDDDE